MWNIVWLLTAVVVLLFGFVVAFGAPYLPTLSPQVTKALDLINLEAGQTLLELGSGDGRLLREAAKRGIYTVGYELNPLLVFYSRLSTWRYRKYVKIVWGNFWNKSWPPCDGIFVFLLDPYMEKLDKKIVQYSRKPVKLVSFTFRIPNRQPLAENSGLYLYQYK